MHFGWILASLVALGAPHVFEPGVVSGPANDSSPTFSSDGNTLLFARSTIGIAIRSNRIGGTGGGRKPTLASFSGTWNDWSPEDFHPTGAT